MEIIVALLAVVLVLAALAAVLLVVRGDGYGHRTPGGPRSWSAGDLPSRPYRELGR